MEIHICARCGGMLRSITCIEEARGHPGVASLPSSTRSSRTVPASPWPKSQSVT